MKDKSFNLMLLIIFISFLTLGFLNINNDKDKFINEHPTVKKLTQEYNQLKYQKDIEKRIQQLEKKIKKLKSEKQIKKN